MILVQTFSDQDHDELEDQMKTLLTFLNSVEKRCQNVRLGDRIYLMQQSPATKEEQMLLLENNEQKLADQRYNGKQFKEAELPRKPIHLRKRTDLKNRTMIKQVRDLLACRPLLNMLQNMWGIRIVSHLFMVFIIFIGSISSLNWNFINFIETTIRCSPLSDRYAVIFRDWMGFEFAMDSVNDNQDSLEASAYVQIMKTAKADLIRDDPMDNPLIQ